VRKHTGKRVWARLGWFAALVYMSGIFVLSSIPGEDLPLPQFPLSDKLAHLVTYGLLGVLIAFRSGLTNALRARARTPGGPLTKGGWIGPAVGIAYAALDELHQSFVPNRTLSLGDFATDVIGVLLGFWLARRWDAARARRAAHDAPPS
jgi:VanZ family protein